MQNEIEHELLKLNNSYLNTATRFPPSVWVENRVGPHRDFRQMAFH